MHVNKLEIEGVAGIGCLVIGLNRGMNIICGPNGIGKTTILESIAQGFAGQYASILKRRAVSERGRVKVWLEGEVPFEYDVNGFLPQESGNYVPPNEKIARYLLSLKVTRTFNYMPLDAVRRDVQKELQSICAENKAGVNLVEVKNWFVNRHLYSKHEGALTEVQLHNIEKAKSFFSLLNPSYKFSRVDASSNEIMIETPSGEILYEYLSSGFKSCISILFGIVKELEFRFSDPGVEIEEFNGVVLIDELELHLHPEWQAKISEVLKSAFPNVQFVVTTHSPHIIQAALPDEIIALGGEGGYVFKRELPETRYGFQGWTIEEVLKDVMGMNDTRTPIYRNALIEFEKAVEGEDFYSASKAFGDLDALLHPENHLRKLLAFQLGALKG